MDVTVAICTYNRARSLERALESIARMTVPSKTNWELVVVNNNCTDETDRIIEKFATMLPLRREFEPRMGLSNARNRAIEAARGAYIVWTDDDVIVDRNWLDAYLEGFRRWPDGAIFGGKILPRFEEPVPRWLVEVFPMISFVYGFRDLG